MTTDLRLNQPRYASLPNIMKAKKKPLEEKTPADYGADVKPRLKVVKTGEPPKRQAGVKVKSVRRTRVQAQGSGSDLMMAVLLIAEHDNASSQGRNPQGADRGAADRRRRACAGRRQQCRWCRGPGGEAHGRRTRSSMPIAPQLSARSPNRWRRSSCRSPEAYDHLVARRHHQRQELHAARRRTSRCHADLRYFGSEVARHLRAPHLCRQCRADRAVDRREEGHHRAHRGLPGDRTKAVPPRSKK